MLPRETRAAQAEIKAAALHPDLERAIGTLAQTPERDLSEMAELVTALVLASRAGRLGEMARRLGGPRNRAERRRR